MPGVEGSQAGALELPWAPLDFLLACRWKALPGPHQWGDDLSPGVGPSAGLCLMDLWDTGFSSGPQPRGWGQLEQVQGDIERGEAPGMGGWRALASQRLIWDWGTDLARAQLIQSLRFWNCALISPETPSCPLLYPHSREDVGRQAGEVDTV